MLEVSNMSPDLIIKTVTFENEFEVPTTSVDHKYNYDITLNNIADHRPRLIINSLHENSECSTDHATSGKIESAINNNSNNNACTSTDPVDWFPLNSDTVIFWIEMGPNSSQNKSNIDEYTESKRTYNPNKQQPKGYISFFSNGLYYGHRPNGEIYRRK